MIVISADKRTGLPTAPPKIVSSGFIDEEETAELYEEITGEVERILQSSPETPGSYGPTNEKIRKTARGLIANATGRRPMIIPVVLEI